jgi:co-chaperonin GroES (HSP10)
LKQKLIIRSGCVRIESLPDDFRNAPLNFNLRQTIIIPDCAKEPSRLARVLALGQKGYQYSVKVGDIVLCPRYPSSFQGYEWRGEKFAVMREEEILAKVVVTNGKV